MDPRRFDRLIKSIATRRISRLTALRGLAAGAVASVTGPGLRGERAAAGTGDKKRRICHRTSASDPGVTMKLKKDEAKRHLREHEFDTKGRCSTTPDPGGPCAADTDCDGGLVCRRGQCGHCRDNSECPNDQLCLDGQCRGGVNDLRFGVGGEDCGSYDPDNPCPYPLTCTEGSGLDDDPRLCLLPNMDYEGARPSSCQPASFTDPADCPRIALNNGFQADTICTVGACVVFCDSPDAEADCTGVLGGRCRNGICYDPV